MGPTEIAASKLMHAQRQKSEEMKRLFPREPMSPQRKAAAVLELLQGENLETLSRGLGVAAALLSGWHDAFLTAGGQNTCSSPNHSF